MPDDLDAEQILTDALAHHESGHADLAEAGYRTVLQYDPTEPDAPNLPGVLLQERGDLDQSIVLPRHALGIEPDFPEALKNLARVQRVAGRGGGSGTARSQAGSEPGRDSVEARLD